MMLGVAMCYYCVAYGHLYNRPIVPPPRSHESEVPPIDHMALTGSKGSSGSSKHV